MVSPPNAEEVSGAAPCVTGRTGGTGGSVCGPRRTGSASASGPASAAGASVRRSRSRRSQLLSVSSVRADAGATGAPARGPEPPRGRSAKRAAMAATLDRPWPSSVDRARRTSATRSGGPVSSRASGTAGSRPVRQASSNAPRAAMSPSIVPVAAGTARSPTSPLGRSTTFSGERPPTARPTRWASATPSARRRRMTRTSRSGIGPRLSRSASVSPSIHSLTTYAALASARPPGASPPGPPSMPSEAS